MFVSGWEDESYCMICYGHGGSSPSQATFVGCTWQGAAPNFSIAETALYPDVMAMFQGQLTFIGCSIINARTWDVTIPKIVSTSNGQANTAARLTLINTALYFVDLTNVDLCFLRNPAGDSGYKLLDDPNANVVMLNCTGVTPGVNVALPDIVPPPKKWQKTATYDPVSLVTAGVGPIQTLAIPGAQLGDLVDASFSLDLQGVDIKAWVSAADTVKYQFRNPTAATIDLASGTVKCRVRK